MKLRVSTRAGICCRADMLLSGLKKSWRVARVKPLAQVNAPPAERPWEKRLVAFICSELYRELPVWEAPI